MASTELLKIILKLIKITPSFNFDDGFDLDDGVEIASCRQTEYTFEIFRTFSEIKNQNSIVYLDSRV